MQKADGYDVPENPQCFLCNPEIAMPEYGYQSEELLRHLREEDRLEQSRIADLFDRSESTIGNWFSEYNIKKPYQYEIPEDELRELYVGDEKSIEEIADYYDCSYVAVRNRMQKYGVKIRTNGESLRKKEGSTEFRNEKRLRELYIDQKLSKAAIAEKCNVSESTIQYWVNKFNIPTRTYSEAQTERNLRGDEPYKDEELLRELYWEEGLTQRQIAERLGCSQTPIQTWMDKYDIELRHTGQEGEFYETKNGEYVRSSGERRIADFLYNHDIEYEYEPDTTLPLRPDFRIGDTFVEYWGMVMADWYCGRMVEKMEEYDEHDEDIIGVYPDDLSSLSFNFYEFC